MAVPEMKIKALAPWFGSKRTLAPRIAVELGDHRDYWEPFCGSMAVLLSKPQSTNETVNDLHGDLVNLARVVQEPQSASRLYKRLRRTLFSEGWHKECQAELKVLPESADPVERAYLYFCSTWMSMSGIAGTKRAQSKLCIRYTSTGGSPTVRFNNAVSSIPAWMRRLRMVRILSRDGIKLIENIPDVAGVAIYADPPYLTKGAQYAHDFDDQPHWLMPDGTIIQKKAMPDVRAKRMTAHEALAHALKRFRKARVVVSYYADPKLADLYPNWNVLDCSMRKAMVCQSARDMKGVESTAPEILIINGPSYAKEVA